MRRLTAGVLAGLAAGALCFAGAVGAIAAPVPTADAGADAAQAAAVPLQPADAPDLLGTRLTPAAAATSVTFGISSAGSYTPRDLAAMYGIPAGAMPAPGTRIAVVVAFPDPGLQADVASYRQAEGLPALTDGQLVLQNENGGASLTGYQQSSSSSQSSWMIEQVMDVDAVSAICPACGITVVYGASNAAGDLVAAAHTAAVTDGLHYVSMSVGVAEESSMQSLDSTFSTPGVLFAAASGDAGYADLEPGPGGTSVEAPSWPSVAPNVLSVGGTSVMWNGSAFVTTGWTGSGSGCSAFEPAEPVAAIADPVQVATCGRHRASADVSALADARTGMAVFLQDGPTGAGWYNTGGTSLATPLITAMYALAGNTQAFSIYGEQVAEPGDWTDITSPDTSGYDAAYNATTSPGTARCAPDAALICTPAAGWDGPTGIGTPADLAALAPQSVSVPSTSPSTSAGTASPTPTPEPGGSSPPPLSLTSGSTAFSATVGDAFSFAGLAVTGGTAPYSFGSDGLPPGLSINAATGAVTGTPTVAGDLLTAVVVTDAAHARAAVELAFHVVDAGTLVGGSTNGGDPPASVPSGTPSSTTAAPSTAPTAGPTSSATPSPTTGTNAHVVVLAAPRVSAPASVTVGRHGAVAVRLAIAAKSGYTVKVSGLPRGLVYHRSTATIAGHTAFAGVRTITVAVTVRRDGQAKTTIVRIALRGHGTR